MKLAHQLADTARAVTLSHFRRESELRQWSKSDGSLATEADLAVEDEIRACLLRERPTDAVLGEERGQTGSGTRRWIVDGIDGTVEFAAGSDDWATLIALEIDGVIMVSVCDQPARNRRYSAARGHGAFFTDASSQSEPRRLHVSETRAVESARSRVPPEDWVRGDRAKRIAATLASATKPQPHGDHPALLVASGTCDVTIFLLAGPWDLAGPLLIVEEAGGRFTDIDGRYDWTTGSAVFSNGHVHDEIIRLMASA
ncbi:MAG TPA: inositol monophosphatase family protein [Gemmatimonadaceae bacterium]